MTTVTPTKPPKDTGIERDIRDEVFRDYVSAMAAHKAEPTEATAAKLYEATGWARSRLKAAKGFTVDCLGKRFTLHENGGISVSSLLAKFRTRVPYLIQAF